MKIGIIVNTEYHHATALSIYESLRHLNLRPVFYHHNPIDRYNFKGFCNFYKLPLVQTPCFDVSIVITALESNDKIPEFFVNPAFRQKNKFIFVHHRPLNFGENIIKKYFPKSKNIANGIYEKPFSQNYFFQTETPLCLENTRQNRIGITSRFFENKISIEYIVSFLKKNDCECYLLGEGSKNTIKEINYEKVKAIDFCNHKEFYDDISKLKFLLIPYDERKEEYTSTKTSESLTHCIANKIPLIANKKLLEHNGLKQIDYSDSNLMDIFNNENKYKLLKDELILFQNNARNHNNSVFKKILEI
jgi:hypothetical protein